MFDAYNSSIKNKCSEGEMQEDTKMRREKKENHLKSLAILGLILILALGLTIFLAPEKIVGAAESTRYKYYTHIVVEEGDSLWDIAGKYMTEEYPTRKEYISEIQGINHLDGHMIYAGQTIIVPYYDDECK